MATAHRSAWTRRKTSASSVGAEGWHGWDAYADFYDWENARTLGRRDVAFWRDFARRVGGRALELGCGTGRITLPLARAGVPIVGIDRSGPMLARARRRLQRARRNLPVSLVRGDIRLLPFGPAAVDLVIAPYGILQSLLSDRDFSQTLASAAAALPRGGRIGIDLVPDVPRWREYTRRVTMSGRKSPGGPQVTLVESVRHDRRRRLTIFDHEYVEGWGRARRVSCFTLTFRTLSVDAVRRRLERAGFRIDAMLGGYNGAPFDVSADAWIILATKW